MGAFLATLFSAATGRLTRTKSTRFETPAPSLADVLAAPVVENSSRDSIVFSSVLGSDSDPSNSDKTNGTAPAATAIQISPVTSPRVQTPASSPEPLPAGRSPVAVARKKSRPELILHRPIDTDRPVQVHEFIWKYGGRQVRLAGSFTAWAPSIEMVPTGPALDYWRALVELDPTQAWQFKFVVDGIWRCSLDLPTCTDSAGNTNNIIHPDD